MTTKSNTIRPSQEERPKQEKVKEEVLDSVRQEIASRVKEGDEISSREFILNHLTFDMTKDGKLVGWAHSHGMHELFGLPDLEVRDITPRFLLPAAGILINEVAQYMIDAKYERNDAKPLRPGETIALQGLGVIVKCQESKPYHPDDKDETETHFQFPRWEIVEEQASFKCARCESGEEHVH